MGAAERAFFEPRFGADFGGVRVHTGPRAARLALALGAHAFTSGSDIVFGHGAYAPGSRAGRRLMAHELTHTIQQGAVAAQAPGRAGPGLASGSASRRSGTRAIQRIRLTRGQFGKAMARYQQDIGVPDRPFRLIWRSSTFQRLVGTLDQHYVSIDEDTLPTYFEVGPDGTLLNDRTLNGPWAGSGRRVIHLWSSGVDESSAFEPASRTTWPYDKMWLHDIFYYTQALGQGMSDVEKDGTFIEALAHETTHAHNLVTGTGHGAAGPNPSLAASIAASVQEEIGTRQRETGILGEVTQGGRLRGFTPSPGATATPEVERSMVSGTPRRTYLESFFFDHKLSEAVGRISDDEARSIERTVEAIPLTAATADRYLDRNRPIFFFDSSLGIYNVLSSDYGKWLFWRRVVDVRWQAFEARPTQPAALRERMLQRHAAAYFDGGVAYTPLPATP